MPRLSTNFLLGKVPCFAMLIILLAVLNTQAQHYTLNAFSGTFTPVAGGTVVSSVQDDDVISGNIPIGFSFNYFGSDYTELKASSNGFVTFDLFETDNNYNEIGSSFYTHNLLAPLWDDLSGSSGQASYLTTGSAGSRVFTFEWLNWQWDYNAAVGISFQVKLYETTNTIEFIYRQEGGALSGADASIGMVGDTESKFYSLANTSASPIFDLDGYDLLNTKPATNQVYAFTPGTTIAPTIQASNIIASDITGSGVNLTWSNGDGAYRGVFMKQTAMTETVSLTDGDRYRGDNQFGDSYVSNDWYCVYNGTGNSVTVSELSSGLPYRVQVVEYNGIAGSQKYFTSTATNNPIEVTTLLVAPVAPTSTPEILLVTGSEVTLDLNEGNGTSRAIFMKATTSDTAPAVDNTTYTASTVFGSGEQIGSTGWYCVFNGESSSDFTITGLSANTNYVIHAVDYNGGAGEEKYNVSSDTDNPFQFSTFEDLPVPDYTFEAATTVFVPITGATALDDIETDDNLSDFIPIGFTFKLGGISFTQLVASSNGVLSFNPFTHNIGTTFATNNLVDGFSRPAIAPLWDDLGGGENGQASYVTTGSAPNRVFTIEYLNWEWDYTATTNISFQVKLHETTNKIEFIYSQEAGALSSPDASIGLAFVNTGTGNFLSLNDAGASPSTSSTTETLISTKPATGQVYRFLVKVAQTITFDPISDKVFGSGTFNLAATSDSGLPVTYSSSDTDVATVSGNIVTLNGVGSVTITASQAGNDSFHPATDVPQTFDVLKGDQTITFPDPGTKEFGATFDLAATSSSGLAISYVSSNTSVATISGSTVTIVGLGSSDITASQAGNANYNAATDVIRTVTALKADQVITFPEPGAREIGSPSFDLEATTNSGLTITYTSSNTDVATISGATVTIIALGTTDITASQAGNANYNAAADVVRTLSVVKAEQVITFAELANKTYGDAPFELSATASSGLEVSYSSSDTDVATISGNTVTIVGGGSVSITATQGGNDIYNSASKSVTLVVDKADQVITFAEIAAKTYGDTPFQLSATASSGLDVTYSSADTDVATVSGNTVTIVGGGSVSITASQAGDNNYNAAVSQSVDLEIAKGSQTITFESISTKTMGDAPFTLNATASSNLPVTYHIEAADEVTLAGNVVTIVNPGSVTIRAHQEGNENYAPTDAESTFCINPAKPELTVIDIDTESPTINGPTGDLGYQWKKDGVEITGEESNTLTVTAAGVYTLTTSKEECFSVPSDAVTLVITGTEEYSYSGVEIFPNPVSTELIVDVTALQSKEPVTIKIFDVTGRALQTIKGNGKLSIKMNDYKSGQYLLKVQGGNRIISRQITKK